ncbi:MAG: TIGR04282 family arsenosugar biosynthesis glycosyltransferase [Ferruginibacter sp.]
MKTALIIFVRKPELGKVKTRLAATLGDNTAHEIYKELLQHTHNIALKTTADRFVFYYNQIDTDDIWNQNNFIKKLQADADLGTKMNDAFAQIFGEGYERVVIIGSDCFELTAEIISNAFKQLNKNDVVIGPANDGGYYLLGMKKLHPQLFENKQWSTADVYQQTIADFEKQHIKYHALVTLRDVDTEEDWLATKNNLS